MRNLVLIAFTASIFSACSKSQPEQTAAVEYSKGQFGYDLKFLKKYHSDLILLGNDSTDGQVIVLPGYQGRVMTSTTSGPSGKTFGWINHELIKSGKLQQHINVFGGEERFWLGPEGGQYSIYFKKGVPFTFDNWFVPKEIDIDGFPVTSLSGTAVSFEKNMRLENYTGYSFELKVNRTVRLIPSDSLESITGVKRAPEIRSVAFESKNTITNTGKSPWVKETGMLSIWILSMLNASSQGVVIIPFKRGDEQEFGPVVTDTYFGKVPADRIQVKDGIIVFRVDAEHRSKIGVSPMRAMPWICSYDSINGTLTVAQFTLPQANTQYVNSLWQIQEHPYKGDAVNAYNDGPLDNGSQLGKFYELESSSPAAALQPGQSLTHIHRTIHFEGPPQSLKRLAWEFLHVDLNALPFN